MPGFSDAELARVVLQARLATPEQVDDARRLIEQMKALGVQRDILGALVDRNVIDQATADRLRRGAAPQAEVEEAKPVGADAALGTTPSSRHPGEVLEAVVVDDAGDEDEELKVAPDDRAGSGAGPDRLGVRPAGAGTVLPRTDPTLAFCYNHPGRRAVAFCSHCNRPVCVHCVIRTDRGTYCSEACALGAGVAAEAVSEMTHKTFEEAVKLGGYLRWVAAGVILVGVLWVTKWLVDDYRVSFALQRAENEGDTSGEGMAALKKAVSLRPRRAELRVRLGKAYFQAGEAGLAIEQLEQAIRRDPRRAEAHLAISRAYVAKGMYREAAGALLKLREIGAADSDSECRLGVIYRDNLDDPAAAVEAFRRALKAGSETRELRYEVGAACFAKGDLAEAKVELLKAVAPLDAEREVNAHRERSFLADAEKMNKAYSMLIEIVEKEGDADALEALLLQARAALPSSAVVAIRRAEMLAAAGRQKEALEALTASRSALSRNPQYLEVLARLQSEAGAQEEALATMRDLHDVAPDRPGVIEGLAALEAAVGDPARTMKLLQSLPTERRASDDLIGVWRDLIRSQLSRGYVASAEKMLKGLGSKGEADPTFAPLWCEVLHRTGRDAEALERAELALRRDPENPTPYLVAGSVLRSLDRTREALQRIRTAAKLGAGAAADLEMAMLYWQGGLKGEASRRLAKVLADPNLAEEKKRLAKAHLARMRLSRAEPPCPSHVVKLLRSRLQAATTGGASIPRIRLATHGVSRAYGMLGGTIGLDPQPGEIEAIQKMSAEYHARVAAGALSALRAESERIVHNAERALRTMYPRASADMAAAAAEYDRRLRSSADEPSKYAAAAVGHLSMLNAALRHHTRAAELAPAMEMAALRMKARKALSPGAVQEATCADLAAVELLAAAIECGPGSFAYQTAVAGVLSDLAAADAEALDPLSQSATGRTGLFRMLQLFVAQAQEMGSVPELHSTAEGGGG